VRNARQLELSLDARFSCCVQERNGVGTRLVIGVSRESLMPNDDAVLQTNQGLEYGRQSFISYQIHYGNGTGDGPWAVQALQEIHHMVF
jgi:hypothetical protein